MTALYSSDYHAWTREQADALERRSANELDWDNLRDEVEGLGKQERSELRSHLKVLVLHLLKWRYQTRLRGRSWMLTIKEQRQEADRVLAENPSLRPLSSEILDDAYKPARIAAARETRLSEATFPETPPFTFDEAMTEPIEWDAPPPRRRSSVRGTKA